jgi:Ca2+/Na+ antiporter
MFNLLIGLGSSIILNIASGKKAPEFKYMDRDGLLPMIGVGALFLELIIIILLSCIFRFYLKKLQGGIQAAFYIAAIAVITVATFTFAG